MKNEILLFSGGLDSFIAWHYLGHPSVLFINANQSYHQKEERAVYRIAKKYSEMKLAIDSHLDLSDWEKDDHYIPFRNVFFTMVASLHADKIYLVGVKGDSVDDNNPLAYKLMSRFYNNFNANKKIMIESPFCQMTKTQIVRWYLDHNLSVNDLLDTRSCYSKDTDVQCGECGSCFRRWVALQNNGIEEHYDKNPWEWAKVKDYLRDIKKGKYDRTRSEETLLALKSKGVI